MASGLDTAVIIAVADFPMAPEFVERWAGLADHISVWFDYPKDLGGKGDPVIKYKCIDVLAKFDISKTFIHSTEMWTLTNYREALLRSLDAVRPTTVIHPDSDECFDEFFLEELEAFKSRPELLLYFDYIMMTEPGYSTFQMPAKTHCKVFKWLPGMSFKNRYLGRATPRYKDILPVPKWNANSYHAEKSRILHYVHYNQELTDYHLQQKAERKARGYT